MLRQLELFPEAKPAPYLVSQFLMFNGKPVKPITEKEIRELCKTCGSKRKAKR